MKNLFAPTHGKSNTKIYQRWSSMKARCYCKSATNYSHYGGRGITMCDEWKSNFMNFYQWAIENGYKEDLTIERIENNGRYEPSNCKWITMKEQNQNKSNRRIITVNGISKSQKEWANIIGISDVCIIHARQKGKNMEEYITAHLKKKGLLIS